MISCRASTGITEPHMIPLLVERLLRAEQSFALLALVDLERSWCTLEVAQSRVAEDDSLFDHRGQEGLVVGDDDKGSAGLLDEERLEPVGWRGARSACASAREVSTYRRTRWSLQGLIGMREDVSEEL